MSLRNIVGNLLRNDVQLNTVIPDERMFGPGVIGVQGEAGTIPPPDISLGPWLSYRFDEEVPRVRDDRTPKASHQEMEIYVHDAPGSYSRIDSALKHVKRIMAAAQPTTNGTVKLMQVDYQGCSQDQFDPEFGTIVRWASFRMMFTE